MPEDIFESTRPPAELDFQNLVSDELMLRAMERNQRRDELSTSKLQNTSFASTSSVLSSTSFGSAASSQSQPRLSKADYVKFKLRMVNFPQF